MHFKIHRGTKEIGGTCIEVWTENTRILLDFGMPLVEKDGVEFDFKKYKKLSTPELIKEGILPDIKGLYEHDQEKKIDGIIVSHAHQDHYGLSSYINKEVVFYLGEATDKIIQLNNLFTPQDIQLKKTEHFKMEKSFKIGDFTITPYWADHSAFDAYSFMIETDGKSIFYSGDFRGHGRKAKAFKWFTHNAPQNVDYLLLEGTTISRSDKPFKTETQIEEDFVNLFKDPDKINLIYTSGQNVDRITSIYKACEKTGKTLVVDVYVAEVLKKLTPFANIPHPSKRFDNLKVIYPKFLTDRLFRQGQKHLAYQFKNYKITKEEISNKKDRVVMLVRPSMKFDIEHIPSIEGGNLIYSMWEGYLKKPTTKKFTDYLKTRNFTIHHIHTSGHADTPTLNKFVKAIDPKHIVPIHTFSGSEYKNIFKQEVVELKDGEICKV